MAGIGVEVDDAAWSAALDRMIALCDEAAFNASMAAAHEIQGRTRALLTAQDHPAHTKTPSAPGSPPAAISGDLAGSVLVSDDGDSALVGPTTVYGRIQELGGEMFGHPMMHWQEPPGVWHHSAHHSLPDRPYLKPATESAVDDGTVHQIYYDHWLRAIEEAT
jgi:phage gpG-like protein